MTGDRKGKLKNQHKKHGKIGLLNSHALCVFFYFIGNFDFGGNKN